MTATADEVVLPTRDQLRPTYRVMYLARTLLALHALVFSAYRVHEGGATHPILLMVLTASLLLWTLGAWALVTRWWRPVWWMHLLDIGYTLAMVGLSGWVIGHEQWAHNTTPLTAYWHVGAPLVIAVRRGPRWGVAAAALVGVVQILTAPSLAPHVWSAAFALLLITGGIGQLESVLRTAIRERDASFARTAVLAERDRMARIVHDGALQVLALVEREGPGLGPTGVRLARLARVQEVHLRAALQDRSVAIPGVEDDSEMVGVATMMDAFASDRVTVSSMLGDVEIPRWQGRELKAAVTQVLQNVDRHAGPDAQAWILVEDTDEHVIVSIRDNGVGMTPDQLAAVMSSNRMGMRASIRGRMEDLGGSATVSSAPGRGVEWELKIPIS